MKDGHIEDDIFHTSTSKTKIFKSKIIIFIMKISP